MADTERGRTEWRIRSWFSQVVPIPDRDRESILDHTLSHLRDRCFSGQGW